MHHSTGKLWLRRSLPFLILVLFIVLAALMVTVFKKEIPQKEEEQTLTAVSIINAQPQTVTLSVESFGNATTKFNTQIVSEVNGRVIFINPNFSSGKMVKKGDLLAQIEPFDYQANLKQAKANLARAEAALEEEMARGQVAKVEFKDYQGVAPDLGLRKPQLKREQANVQFAKAELERAERNLSRTKIVAPFDGIVRARKVDLGQYVNLGTQLGQVFENSVARVRLPIKPNQIAFLAADEQSEVTLYSPNDSRQTWQGLIIRREQFIDEQSRMSYLVAEILDPYGLNSPRSVPLPFGQYVKAEISGKTIDNLYVLPNHYLRNQEITVLEADNTIRRQKVSVLYQKDGISYVNGGIEPGQRIITSSTANLTLGQEVAIAADGE